MENEGLWHLLEHIFGYLDYETVVICRKVSYLWDELLEPLERSFLVNILQEFGVKIAEEYHRSRKEETEEESLRDKLQDEHMKEIEKKKESEENYFCSHSKRQDSMLSTVEGEC